MNKLMTTCFAAVALSGHIVTANAAALNGTMQVTPVAISPASTTSDLPYIVAKLQGDVQTLQTEVQDLQRREGQDPRDSQYIFSAAPPPNADGAPIPSGG
jgi:hypothetical protein